MGRCDGSLHRRLHPLGRLRGHLAALGSRELLRWHFATAKLSADTKRIAPTTSYPRDHPRRCCADYHRCCTLPTCLYPRTNRHADCAIGARCPPSRVVHHHWLSPRILAL